MFAPYSPRHRAVFNRLRLRYPDFGGRTLRDTSSRDRRLQRAAPSSSAPVDGGLTAASSSSKTLAFPSYPSLDTSGTASTAQPADRPPSVPPPSFAPEDSPSSPPPLERYLQSLAAAYTPLYIDAFASTVAPRLRSIGITTVGQLEAALRTDLAQVCLDLMHSRFNGGEWVIREFQRAAGQKLEEFTGPGDEAQG